MARFQYTGIDLFAGAGGLSYGLSRAGISMKAGLEIDPISALNLEKNNKNTNVIVSDILKINPLQFLDRIRIKKEKINIIAGGPPCQGFSQSNRRTRMIENPSNSLYVKFFEFIKYINPEVFLLENVAGLKTLNKGETYRDILKIGNELGYDVQCDIISAEKFGIPQKRKRIFFIGTKSSTDINFLKNSDNELVTVRDAIDDLPRIDNGNLSDKLNYAKNTNLSVYQKKMRCNSLKSVSNNLVTKNRDLIIERYRYIPQGGNWRNIPQDLLSNYKNPNNCHGWIYYRLKWDEPSVVVSNYRKNMLIHPEFHRGLSVREAARLQSFPDNYLFYGRLDYQQQMVANAVPPMLAEKIGAQIISYLKESI